MDENIYRSREFLLDKGYRKMRCQDRTDMREALRGLSDTEKLCRRFEQAVADEKPVFYSYDEFGFNRYRARLPIISLDKDYPFFYHDESFGNITIDYETLLKKGLSGIRADAERLYDKADEEGKLFYFYIYRYFDACELIVKKYTEAAIKCGKERLAAALRRVPMEGAANYFEALVCIKFIHYALRLNACCHLTLGRFDQYIKPYFDVSVRGGMDKAEALYLTEAFFISLNYDGDLYQGIQQGDNGQSMVLGGCDENGKDALNEISEICLTASEELKLIDPKINLRVNKKTPLSLYERGTKLTKQGLGFPQYSNDDVVIGGLVSLGYDLKDARNYTVAACWEFIVPRCGADIPNIEGGMNFPLVIRNVMLADLTACKTFSDFRAKVREAILKECEKKVGEDNAIPFHDEPFISAFVQPCIAKGREINHYGAKYNNYGIHGVGIANGADAMEAVRIAVYKDGFVTKEELIYAIEQDFKGYENLQKKLLSLPKMGNNIDSVDEQAAFLMDAFADGLNGKMNNRGGIYRAGTGSAMEYQRKAKNVGATADGRNAGTPYSSSFSPSLTAKLNGPFSAIQSFTKYDLKKIINGGPFTMEIHDTVFRNHEGEKKVAMLVKTFIDFGGHQLQLNSVNRATLLDAQKHPEKYPNLVVRVWGWSGYFNELSQEYQDHVIARTEFRC